MGRQLHLPQTAVLALRAPEQYVYLPYFKLVGSLGVDVTSRIPFLYEQAFQWYTSFDPLGELIDRPNPTPALDLMSKVIEHLTRDCAWPPHRIHLFGFAQGGSVAAEFALKYWRTALSQHQKSLPPPGSTPDSGGSVVAPHVVGSIVSVSGPLISYPTLPERCPTPFLIFHRPPPAESALPPDAMTALKKGFTRVEEVKMKGEGMPRSKEEFEPIMRFWSEHIGRRPVEGLYEVMSGMTAPLGTQLNANMVSSHSRFMYITTLTHSRSARTTPLIGSV